MRKQYVVRLPEAERAALLTMVGRGAAPARVATRNAAVRTIDWRFTTDDARIKLDHLYPVFHA